MEDFLKLYEEIFDEHGYVRLCGREKCKELISLAQTIDSKSDFGNINTGFMNINNLTRLYMKVRN